MLQEDYTTKVLGLQDANILDVEETEDAITIYAQHRRRAHRCPACGSMTEKVHDYRWQRVKDVPLRGKATTILLRKRRYACRCGKRFAEQNEYLGRYQRMAKRVPAAIIQDLRQVVSFQSVAARYNVSPTTVLRIFDCVSYPAARIQQALSIDEFKGNTGGEKYNVILADPQNKTVLDILPKRYSNSLSDYFSKIPRKEREKVRFFVSDMWKPYAETASVYFKNATQLVDKYHWMRQVIWAFEAVRKDEQKRLGAHYRKCFKHARKLLWKQYSFLKNEQKEQVNAMLAASAKLCSAHFLKESFLSAVSQHDAELAVKQLADWMFHAEQSGIPAFVKCAETFHNWFHGIRSSLQHPYTNGFVEGCNNKIKVLKRNAYGYQNFRRFRNRILHIFSDKTLQTAKQTAA